MFESHLFIGVKEQIKDYLDNQGYQGYSEKDVENIAHEVMKNESFWDIFIQVIAQSTSNIIGELE